MLKIGKIYRVKTLEDFKKMNVIIKYHSDNTYSITNKKSKIGFMNSEMTKLKKVTINRITFLRSENVYSIKEDCYNWESWMLKGCDLIMNTE